MPASAYVGPGLGAGALAVVLGVIAAFGMALVAVLWYPIKRMIKRNKSKGKVASNKDEADE